jgi:hypothetical protein
VRNDTQQRSPSPDGPRHLPGGPAQQASIGARAARRCRRPLPRPFARGRSDARRRAQLARTFQGTALEVRAREDRLRQELRELRIEIDEQRQDRKVAEITGTEYFKNLRDRAKDLRKIIED